MESYSRPWSRKLKNRWAKPETSGMHWLDTRKHAESKDYGCPALPNYNLTFILESMLSIPFSRIFNKMARDRHSNTLAPWLSHIARAQGFSLKRRSKAPLTVAEFNKQLAHSNVHTISCNRLTKASEHCKKYDKTRVNLYFNYKYS